MSSRPASHPQVPAPCGGNVGAVQRKAAGTPARPAVPAPCGGNVGLSGAPARGVAQRTQGPTPPANAAPKPKAGPPKLGPPPVHPLPPLPIHPLPPLPVPPKMPVLGPPPPPHPVAAKANVAVVASSGAAAAGAGAGAGPAAAAAATAAGQQPDPKEVAALAELNAKLASQRGALVKGAVRDWIALWATTGTRAAHQAASKASTATAVASTVTGVLAEVASGGTSGGAAFAATSTAVTAAGAAADGVETGFSVEVDVRLAQMLMVVDSMEPQVTFAWLWWLYARREGPDFNALYQKMFADHIRRDPTALAITKSVAGKVGMMFLKAAPGYALVSNAQAAHTGADEFGVKTPDALRVSINAVFKTVAPNMPLPFPQQSKNMRSSATGFMGF